MNATYWYMILLFFGTVQAAGQEETFAQANNFYRVGDYEQAMNSYDSIKNKDAAVWYNMGNVAYHLQDYMHAYIYWLRAQKYGDADIFKIAAYNLEKLSSVRGKDGLGLFDHMYIFLLSLIKRWSLFTWQRVLIVLWCVFLWLWLHYDNRKIKRLLLSVLFVLLICVFGLVMIGYSTNKAQAVMLADTQIYNGPNSSFYTVATIPKGALIQIAQTDRRWYKILHDDIIGWVERSALAKI